MNKANYLCKLGISYLDQEMLHIAQNSNVNVIVTQDWFPWYMHYSHGE